MIRPSDLRCWVVTEDGTVSCSVLRGDLYRVDGIPYAVIATIRHLCYHFTRKRAFQSENLQAAESRISDGVEPLKLFKVYNQLCQRC